VKTVRHWRNIIAVYAAVFAPASAATITGKVVADHSSVPVASAEVRFYTPGLSGLAADLETDADGRFTAPGLPEGDYRLEISKPNFVNATLRLHLTSRDSPVFARLVRCGAITGQVKDPQGQPVRSAVVFAIKKPSDNLPLRPDLYTSGHMANTDARGQYRIYNLPPGQYAIAVSYGASTVAVGSTGGASTASSLGSGFLFYPENTHPQFFTFSGGEELRNIDFSIFTAALFNVSGAVLLPDPKARFWLALSTPDQPALAVAVTQAEADGKFRFTGVPAGRYNLLAIKTGGARSFDGAIPDAETMFGRTTIQVGPQDVKDISVMPETGRAVTFTLRRDGAQGGCPATAQLVLSPLEDWGAHLERRESISAGKEETITGLAPARYAISVAKLGDSCFTTTTNQVIDLSSGAAPGTIAVPIASAGAIRGRLDTPGFEAVLLAADSVLISVPDAESRFTFAGLRPGRYRISAQPAGETAQAHWLAEGAKMLEFDVAGGATLEIDLAAPGKN
jgi:uncharacterized protein (DUF2141 family)